MFQFLLSVYKFISYDTNFCVYSVVKRRNMLFASYELGNLKNEIPTMKFKIFYKFLSGLKIPCIRTCFINAKKMPARKILHMQERTSKYRSTLAYV